MTGMPNPVGRVTGTRGHTDLVAEDAVSREQARSRLELVLAILVGIDNWEAVGRMAAVSRTRQEAAAGIAAQFGWATSHADYILDTTFGRSVAEDRDALEREADRLRSLLGLAQGGDHF